jgi:hypothetical protein
MTGAGNCDSEYEEWHYWYWDDSIAETMEPSDVTVPSWQKDEGTKSNGSPPVDPEPRNSLPRGRNKIRKGTGPDSKAGAPDTWDNYDYLHRSGAYSYLRILGYAGIVLGALGKVVHKVEGNAKARGISLTP